MKRISNISLVLVMKRAQESDFCMVDHQEKVWGHQERIHMPEFGQVCILVRALQKGDLL